MNLRFVHVVSVGAVLSGAIAAAVATPPSAGQNNPLRVGIVAATGADSAGDAIALGVVLGIGFGMVGALVSQVYESKGNSYFLINGLNAVIAYSIVAVILTLWN